MFNSDFPYESVWFIGLCACGVIWLIAVVVFWIAWSDSSGQRTRALNARTLLRILYSFPVIFIWPLFIPWLFAYGLKRGISRLRADALVLKESN